MSPRVRWTVLLSALAVVMWLLAHSPLPKETDVVEAFDRQDAAPARASGAEPRILALAPRVPIAEGGTLFASTSWVAPPGKAAPPPPPPPPVAPALPFKYVGKQRSGDGWQVFVARGDQVIVIGAGDAVEGMYRVDAIKPPTMTLTYIPLNEEQTLSIGDAE